MPSLFNQTIIYPEGFNLGLLSFIIPMGCTFSILILILLENYFKCCLKIHITNNIKTKKFIIKDMEYYSNANKKITGICSICIENIEDIIHIIIMPCKHIFHKDCIQPWLLQKIIIGKKPECPMCRFQFEIEYLKENQIYRNKQIIYNNINNINNKN